MRLFPRLARAGAVAAVTVSAAVAAVTVLPAPASAAATVSVVAQVRIDQVGIVKIAEERPGEVYWPWSGPTFSTPYHQWVDFRMTVPLGTIVHVAEMDSYGAYKCDDDSFTVVAGQQTYRVDLTRNSTPDCLA